MTAASSVSSLLLDYWRNPGLLVGVGETNDKVLTYLASKRRCIMKGKFFLISTQALGVHFSARPSKATELVALTQHSV